MSEGSIGSWEDLQVNMLRSLPEPAMITDLQGSIEFVNDRLLQLVGLTQDETVGQPFPYPWLLPKEQLDRLPWVNHSRQFEGATQVEGLVIDTEGNHRIINFSVSAMQGPEGGSRRLLSVGRDITPQRDAAEFTPIQKTKYLELSSAPVVEELPLWVQLCQMDGTIEAVNDAACTISGYDRSQMVGQSWPYPWFLGGWGEQDGDPFTELNRTGLEVGFETTCRSQQGDSRALSITLSPFPVGNSSRVLLVAKVPTECKQWEEQLLQAEKIRAVSQLASGVSHDINNDLAVILGYSEYLLSRANDLDESLRQALDAIQQQAHECAATVRRIQLFSLSPPRSKFTNCCINDVVRQVVEVTESKWQSGPHETSGNIGIDTDLKSTPPVLGHFGSFIEVVSSLVNNAVAALPHGGTVSFRSMCEDEVVILEIADDGVGIDPSHMKRIFEPFFTTKGPTSTQST